MDKVAYLGISRESLPVPGETLAEVLAVRGMSQKELAERTGVTEAFVSQVIKGTKRISQNFAKKLDFAMGIDAVFWLNLQLDYDAALADLNEQDSIDDDERDVLDLLRSSEVLGALGSFGLLKNIDDLKDNLILSVRRALGVSSLLNLETIATNGAFRVGEANIKPAVLGAWLLLAKRITDQDVDSSFDRDRMPELVVELKQVLAQEGTSELQKNLKEIFRKYGIVFAVMRHFRGAPVQGYIARGRDSSYRMVLTIRGKSADRFWFTLFHELGHIANGDCDRPEALIDAMDVDSEKERKADLFARRTLIDEASYNTFADQKDFSTESITSFAQSQGVPMWIVKGRLQKDNYVDWNDRRGMVSYDWVEA